jgi:hypothetical protein
MRATSSAVILGIIGFGLVLSGQLLLTPANMLIFSAIIAVFFGVFTGLVAVRSSLNEVSRPTILIALIVGGGIFLGMIIGAVVYLNLPSTQTYYSLYNQGKQVSAPLNSFLAEDYVGFCSGVSGIVNLGLVVGISQIMVARSRKRVTTT